MKKNKKIWTNNKKSSDEEEQEYMDQIKKNIDEKEHGTATGL